MAGLLTLLCACATAPQLKIAARPSPAPPAPLAAQTPTGPRTAPPVTAPAAPTMRFADLAGWDQEDHAAALDAFRAGCGVSTDTAWREVCQRARDLGPQDEVISRAFLETNFSLQPVADEGLLTGYFAPEYPARHERGGAFTAPVRALPADLVTLDLSPLDPDFQDKAVGRMRGGRFTPYPERAAIEKARDKAPLAWMKPEDLFFLQIQGSGVLTFPDGERSKALYAGNNGRPFSGIAAAMRDKGLLPDKDTSGDAIRKWLADHRGPEADAIMRLDTRYVFFSLQPDDGRPPVGAAGAPLTPGRAIAIDPSKHAFGGLYWISADAPALSGAFPSYRRLAMALDTGSAIKGVVRADLYTGQGDAAGQEAGRVRHRLKMVALTPVIDAPAQLANAEPSAGPRR
ncbi:MAG TPA: MltA domain-containing protein [Caulobacteraceae bacterium]|nr:MltA domain-containing protein [Caulobacteraceae bacterium]